MTHWTELEDARLLQALQDHPTLSMSGLQMHSFPDRTPDALRQRRNRLIKKKFTRAEDILIAILLYTGHDDIYRVYRRYFVTRHCARDVTTRARLLRNTDMRLETSQEIIAALSLHDHARVSVVRDGATTPIPSWI
jgi:hypothetical protein